MLVIRMIKIPSTPLVRVIHVPNFTRAYLRHLFVANEILGARLLTLHNLFLYQHLMALIRNTIPKGLEPLNRLREDVKWMQPLSSEG